MTVQWGATRLARRGEIAGRYQVDPTSVANQVDLRAGSINEGLHLMTYWTAPAKPASRTLALAKIIALTVPLTVALSIAACPFVSAQDQPAAVPAPAAAPAPKEKPKPAKKPKAAAPAAQQPAPAQQAQEPAPAPQGQQQGQAGQQQVQLIFSPWTKFCLKGQPGQAPDPNAKQICFTGKDARIESGMPVAAAVLIEPEGQERKILRVTLPLGMQLAHGTRVIIDQSQPLTAPYVICFTNGCMADYEANVDMIGKMKKGQGLVIQAINSTGQPISLAMPLTDFAKAYDGPPTDPKVFEEQQKKLQEELQRRADEARKKLENQQGGAPQSSATPPPAPAPGGKTQ
jgi:invasion protein IalB